MQNFTRMKILVVGIGMMLSMSGGVAEAAPVRQFEVGYGWDAGFAYGQAEPLAGVAELSLGSGGDVVPQVAAPHELYLEEAVGVRKSAAVPVPGSLVLFGTGLLLLAVVARRRAQGRVW